MCKILSAFAFAMLAAAASTMTDSSGNGTITTEAGSGIAAPTIATAAAGVTITNLVNLYLAAPIAGTHVTATNLYGLFDASGLYVGSAAVNLPSLGTSSAATTGTVCWTTGTNADFLCLATGGPVLVQTCTISSKRFKEHLIDWRSSALPVIGGMEVVSFNMKPREKPNPDPNFGTRQIGLTAENVAKSLRSVRSMKMT